MAKLLGKKTESPQGEESEASLREQVTALSARIAEYEGAEAELEEKFTALEKERDGFKAKVEGAETAQKTAEGKVSGLEKERDEAVKAKADAEKAKGEAETKLKDFEAALPGKVAQGVTDRLAALGVKEDALPKADDKGPGKTEHEGLKGLDRAAAAFGAQFAGAN